MIGEDLVDAVAIGIADEESARPAPDLRESLAALANSRRVDNGQHFLGVMLDHRVEQGLVAVLEIAHEGVSIERVLAQVECALPAEALILEGPDVGR